MLGLGLGVGLGLANPSPTPNPNQADYWLQHYGRDTDGEGARARSQPPAGALSLGVAAHPSLDAWGLGLLLYELFCGVALFAGAKERAHFAALADGSCRVELGAVSAAAPRHLLAKLLRLDPAERCSLDEAASHAYLSGGLDTLELAESFQGLQRQQEAMQDEMARIEAELTRRDKLQAEEAQRMSRYADAKKRSSDAASTRRRSIFNAPTRH